MNRDASSNSSSAELIHRHSRSFSVASRCLPKSVRGDTEKLYAWCRTCDDAVDSAESFEIADITLTQLRTDITGAIPSDQIQHPASRWIRELITERGIDQAHALDLLEGMRMDLEGIQIRNEQDLLRYAYHVAGVVGLMMSRLLGVDNVTANGPAKDLGIAMQLTNIARDVLEDSQRGRCYLPGIDDPSTSSPVAVESSVQRILKLADDYYASGRSGIGLLPWRCRFAVSLAANLYREIGLEIARNDYRVMQGRTVLPRWRIVLVLIRTVFAPLHAKVAVMRSSNVASSFSLSRRSMMKDARYIAYLGLSLTSFTATGLFLLVYFNPKESTYTWLPLVYAAVSLLVGVVCNRLAARNENTAPNPDN